MLVGPIGTALTTAPNRIEYQPSGFISREKVLPFFGEKPVYHEKTEGSITIDPSSAKITADPTPTYPKRVRLSGSTPNDVFANGGRCTGIASWSYVYSNIRFYTAVQFYGGGYRVLTADCRATRPTQLIGTICRVYTPFVVDGSATAKSTRLDRSANTYINLGSNAYGSESLSAQQLFDLFDEHWLVDSGPFYATIPCYTVDNTAQLGNLDVVKNWIDAQARMISAVPSKEIGETYGELAQRAAEKSNDVNINMLAFVKDLKDIKSLVRSFSNLRRAVRMGFTKKLAGVYLASKYGVLPTADDIRHLWMAFQKHRQYDRNGFATYRSGNTSSADLTDGITLSVERHLKLAVDKEDNAFDLICQKFDNLGFLPTFENVWDLVPYTFVVDWLVDIGGFLESFDARQRIARLNIRYVTMSQKVIKTKEYAASVELPYSGTISTVRYNRWVTNRCPQPPLTLQSNISSFDHWVEALALIIQRKTH